MERLHSYDIHGPIGRIRTAQFHLDYDPLGFRDPFRYDFEVEVADTVEMTAQAEIRFAGKPFKAGSTFNDFYGLGTCRRQAADEAIAFDASLVGSPAEVIVTVTAQTKMVMFDTKKEPFYCGCVRAFYIPTFWRMEGGWDARKAAEPTREFIVYHNGQAGEDEEAYTAFVAEAKAMDAAQDRRKLFFDGSREVR